MLTSGIRKLPIPKPATEAKFAIALMSLPHFIGNSVRFWLLKSKINRRILIRFGLLSAAGGLIGALIHVFFVSNVLQIIFSSMLILAGILGVLQVSERLRLGKLSASIVGFASGFFGGLVGEQGGIRSVALLGFDIEKEAFIATATATALIVDIVRMPIYFIAGFGQVNEFLPIIVLSSTAVIGGTLVGNSILKRIPQELFKRLVSFLILLLGILLLIVAL